MADRGGRKRAVSLSVDGDLLDAARQLGINLSETLESELRARMKAESETRWLEENGEAISSVNDFIDRHGLVASKLRYREG